MDDLTNTILAMVLSALVLIGWEYFVGQPQIASHKGSALQQVQTQLQPGSTSRAPQQADLGARAQTAVTPSQPESRAAALTRSPRVEIKTPSLRGSIALERARIDDLSLVHYHQTVDPHSPEIVLLSPADSQAPYYAGFGWTDAKGVNVAVPGPNTKWRQEGSGHTRHRASGHARLEQCRWRYFLSHV
jgi:YidC/Oxa1 family membrane protein insertase